MLEIYRNIRSGLRSQPWTWASIILTALMVAGVFGWSIVTGERFRGSGPHLVLILIVMAVYVIGVVRRGPQKTRKKSPLEKLQDWDRRDGPF